MRIKRIDYWRLIRRNSISKIRNIIKPLMWRVERWRDRCRGRIINYKSEKRRCWLYWEGTISWLIQSRETKVIRGCFGKVEFSMLRKSWN